MKTFDIMKLATFWNPFNDIRSFIGKRLEVVSPQIPISSISSHVIIEVICFGKIMLEIISKCSKCSIRKFFLIKILRPISVTKKSSIVSKKLVYLEPHIKSQAPLTSLQKQKCLNPSAPNIEQNHHVSLATLEIK